LQRFAVDGMCFGNLYANNERMKKLKKLLEQISTGDLKKLGLHGIFSGKYQMAVIILKHKL
jgi:hypothetical protein